jgi:hypothetical protein
MMPLLLKKPRKQGEERQTRFRNPEMMMRIRVIVAAGFLAIAGLFATGAQAQEGGLFSLLGITPKPQPDIDYRERAPLVVPPSRELPAPVEYSEADKASWPKDPDVRRKQRDAFLAKNPPSEQTAGDKRIDFIRKTRNKNKNVGGAQGEAVEAYLANGEPRRRYLTDPPEGARAPAVEPPPTAPLQPQ